MFIFTTLSTSLSCPVWHMIESVEKYDELVDRYPFHGLYEVQPFTGDWEDGWTHEWIYVFKQYQMKLPKNRPVLDKDGNHFVFGVHPKTMVYDKKLRGWNAHGVWYFKYEVLVRKVR